MHLRSQICGCGPATPLVGGSRTFTSHILTSSLPHFLTSQGSHLPEGLRQILLQILDVLDAGRDAHQAVGDAERGASSAGTDAWVIVAGCEISVSTPPRLSASAMQPDGVQQPPRRLERSELERQHAAEAAHLALRQLVLRMGRQARVVDVPHLRVRGQELAPAPGRSRCAARMRSGSVLVPRSTSHESNGLRIAPSAFCTNLSHSMSSSRDATTTPPTLSLWPFRYLVVLCVDEVGAELDRPLDVRAREGVVDDQAQRRAGGRGRPPARRSVSAHASDCSASRRTACASPA